MRGLVRLDQLLRYGSGVLRIPHHASHITHHTSRITHHASRITHHTSRITHHASRITHHASRSLLHLLTCPRLTHAFAVGWDPCTGLGAPNYPTMEALAMSV
jgi:hypothetical protein